MKNRILVTLLGLGLFTGFTPSIANAQTYLDLAGLSPSTHYKTFETEHFRFIYQEGYFNFTARAAEHIEHAHEVLSPILKWQPRYKTDILVADNEDNANGFTMPALRVGIVLIATPPEGWFSTSYSDDWIKLLVFHEYTHFLNIDATRGLIEVSRWFFGDVIRPNGLWPVWMLEGLAVYYETRTSKMGRGRSPYYDGVLRAYLEDNRLGTYHNRGITLDRMNGSDPYFPSGEIPYLFGYHMWDQFSKDHSRVQDTDAAMGELSWRSAGRIPFFIEGNLDNVMGKSWSDYWDSFLQESKTRLGSQIERVKKIGETQHELLTQAEYSSLLGAISPNGEWLAYSETSLDDLSRLVLINLKTKETRKLDQKMLGVGMGFTPDSKHLIYSTLIRTGTYSTFSDLFLYDLEKDKVTSLSTGLRGKDPSVSPDGSHVIFVQSVKATNVLRTAKLVNSDGKYSLSEIKTLYTPPEFSLLSTPRFVTNDQVVFARQDLGKTQSDLNTITLSNGEAHTLFADGAINRQPSAQNGNIYFVSDKSGIENVSMIPANGGPAKKLTNVTTGTALPIMAPDGTLYGSYLTSNGYEIAKFQGTHPIGNDERIATPSAPESLPSALKAPTLHFDREVSEDYSPWSSMAPRQWAPVSLLTYNSQSGLSLLSTVLGFDTTGKHQYFGYAGYNFKPTTVDGGLSYTYYGFRPVISISASSVTTDIASDFNSSQYRNSKNVTLAFSYPIRYTYSSLTPSVYGFVGWNRVYDLNSKKAVSVNDFEYSKPMVPGFGASLSFSDAQNTRLGIVPEYGNDFVLAAEDRFNISQYSVIKYLGSYAHYFKVTDHSVLVPKGKFLGSSYPVGYDHSYARFQGKNTSDIYDRGDGLNLNRIGVRGYADMIFLTRQTLVGSLDYHFPIFRPFAGLGTDPLFLKQLHGFVFGETAYIPSTKFKNLYLPSFGGGLSLDTQILIRVPLRVNLEVQNGTRKDFGGDTSVFLSLEGGSLF